MSISKHFHFKKFTVAQDRCAMKIGTDGVLLGAWTSLENHPDTILDIGAGTGVISLMLAQRCDAETIDAIEIDDDAYEQCTENFENSNWADRLFCYHASVQEFAFEDEDENEIFKYDLIVSNPPFYSENYKTVSDARNKARFNDALPFQHLIACAAHLLSQMGTFNIIIPKTETENVISLASAKGLYPHKICNVKGTPNSEVKRSMLCFGFRKKEIKTTSLTIEIERHRYTEAYKNLVKDFYLKM